MEYVHTQHTRRLTPFPSPSLPFLPLPFQLFFFISGFLVLCFWQDQHFYAYSLSASDHPPASSWLSLVLTPPLYLVMFSGVRFRPTPDSFLPIHSFTTTNYFLRFLLSLYLLRFFSLLFSLSNNISTTTKLFFSYIFGHSPDVCLFFFVFLFNYLSTHPSIH